MWTFTQIFSWSVIGLLSGALGKWFKRIPAFVLSIYSGLCGLFFGLVFSIQNVVVGNAPFWPYYLAGLPFDINHAVGNMVFFIVLYPILSKLLNEKASFIVSRKQKPEYPLSSSVLKVKK
jgi:energy-coupling factor transport system substrate-specific component